MVTRPSIEAPFSTMPKVPFPEEEPEQEGHRQRPPAERYPARELKCEADAADLRGEDQEGDQSDRHERQEEEGDAEALAHRIGEWVMAHGGQPAAHLHQEGDAYST